GCSVSTGQILVSATGGTPGYTYSSNCGSTYQASSTFTGLGSGTYCILVQDANGCTSSSNETVTAVSPINFATSTANETCNSSNGSIIVSASGGDMHYSYSINGGSTFQTSNSFSGVSAGVYNVFVTDLSNCIDSNLVTITNIGSINASTTGNQTICSGDQATIGASGGSNYNWLVGMSSIGNGSSLIVTPTNTTTYTVIADDGMCFDTATLVITVTPLPVTTVSSDTSICAGEILQLVASGGTSYLWPHSGETTAVVSVSPSTPTTYSVTAFNGVCTGNTAQVVISID